jgi:orotate phosphoribosyltransferase
LRNIIREKSLCVGDFTLSSGRKTNYYLDCRITTLHPRGALLIARLILQEIRDRRIQADAIGGLTLGADPLALSMLHAASASARRLDAFVVRKAGKAHGLQRRIEGPEVVGRRVLAVEDTSTTGGSVLTAVEALQEAGAEVVGVAVIVDRGAGDAVRAAGLPYRAAYTLADLGLVA